jgi:hypothetical protein
MAIPSINNLKMWVGTLFTKDDWDFNFSQLVSWLADGTSDLVVNTVKTTNGLDLDGAQISNVGPATTGSQAINLDQANTILNRTSYYYPFSVGSGKVDSNGDAAYLQKDSDTQVTVLAGNVNPDLVCIQSDGTVESVTSNTILTVPSTDGTYYIVKEKEQSITITTGSANKISIGKTFPTSQNTGDYFLDDSVVPFKGYKYGLSGWEETPFCYLGYVTVSSGTATVKTFVYNNNDFDVNIKNLDLLMPAMDRGSTVSIPFTAEKDGWLYVEIWDSGAHALSFDGHQVWTTQGDEYVGDSTFLPVPKGTYVTDYRVNGYTKVFYPCKGAQ